MPLYRETTYNVIIETLGGKGMQAALLSRVPFSAVGFAGRRPKGPNGIFFYYYYFDVNGSYQPGPTCAPILFCDARHHL